MSAQEIVLNPTNRPPIAFQGRIVAQAIGPVDDPRLLGRQHAISVYETDSGDLHLTIEFKTACEHETPRFDIELGILPDELSEILLAYDATEYVNRDRLDQRHEGEVTHFFKRLHQQYDDLCASVERQMLGYQPLVRATSPEDVEDQASQASWKSWIPFGKPR